MERLAQDIITELEKTEKKTGQNLSKFKNTIRNWHKRGIEESRNTEMEHFKTPEHRIPEKDSVQNNPETHKTPNQWK